MVMALTALGLLAAAALALRLSYPAIRLRMEPMPMADRIDAILPQTQCRQCGYAGCRPYAQAIAAGAAQINQCPPGGGPGIRALAALLGRAPLPLDTSRGEHKSKHLARIDEQDCIGCTLCLQACPVDAILGATKHMHTVIAAECTGCELCLEPCPVDCIEMVPIPAHTSIWKQLLAGKVGGDGKTRRQADHARRRHESRLERLERDRQERERRLREHRKGAPQDARKAVIEAALKRVKAKKAAAEAARNSGKNGNRTAHMDAKANS